MTVDYHDENCVIRRRDLDRGTEEVLTVPTTAGDLLEVLADAPRRAGPRGPWCGCRRARPGGRASARW